MRTYVVRRLWQSALTLVGVSVLVFLILRVVPGDPAKMLPAVDNRVLKVEKGDRPV